MYDEPYEAGGGATTGAGAAYDVLGILGRPYAPPGGGGAAVYPPPPGGGTTGVGPGAAPPGPE